MIKQNWYTHKKTFPQNYDYEFLNLKYNENFHHKIKGAVAVKPISEVPHSGTVMG